MDFPVWPGRTVPGGPDGRDPLAAHKRMVSGACAHRGGILGQTEKSTGCWEIWGAQHLPVFELIFDQVLALLEL